MLQVLIYIDKDEIYIDKDEITEAKPLFEFIIQLLLDQGISGATAFQGVLGFGKHHYLKHPTQLFSFDETPMLICFVDEDEKVKDTMKKLRKHYQGGLMIMHPVEFC